MTRYKYFCLKFNILVMDHGRNCAVYFGDGEIDSILSGRGLLSVPISIIFIPKYDRSRNDVIVNVPVYNSIFRVITSYAVLLPGVGVGGGGALTYICPVQVCAAVKTPLFCPDPCLRPPFLA